MMLTMIQVLSLVVLVLLMFAWWIVAKIIVNDFRYELEDYRKRKAERPIAIQKLSFTSGVRLKSGYIIDLYMKNGQHYHNMIIGAIEEDALKGYFRPSIPYFSETYPWIDIDHIEIVGLKWKYFIGKPIEDDGLKVGV